MFPNDTLQQKIEINDLNPFFSSEYFRIICKSQFLLIHILKVWLQKPINISLRIKDLFSEHMLSCYGVRCHNTGIPLISLL